MEVRKRRPVAAKARASQSQKDSEPEMLVPADRLWLPYAVASGASAAFNGVFAKLTTTQLTTSLSTSIAGFLAVPQYETALEYVIRAVFFLLNITFNGIMWTFFTAALKKAKSATQVAVMNTSTNFLVTAFAGVIIFSETLPPTWWAGASLLVAGSVVAAQKGEAEEGHGDDDDAGSLETSRLNTVTVDGSGEYD